MFSGERPRHRAAHSNGALVLPALFLLAMVLCFPPTGYAQNRDRVGSPVEPANRVSLTGHHPSWASGQNDLGPVPADLSLGQFEFVLARSPQQQAAFDQFLLEQLDPSSPNYHHWLTSVEIGARYGASQHDLDAVTNWLQSQNLHMDAISNSRVRIEFSGPASAVGNAFGAEMHNYLVDGERRFSIVAEPQIPVALAGIIKSISGLSTVDVRPMHEMSIVRVPARNTAGGLQSGLEPDFTSSGGFHFLFPSDFAAIYDLPTGTFTGAGQTIAVIGISRVNPLDITNFQARAGLSQQLPTEIIPPGGVDPGPAQTAPPMSGSASAAQGEATLDVTRAGSIAPGATIDLVVSATSGGGISIASEYVVDANPVFAHIMTISFGACESNAGQSGVNFWDSIFSQASMEGISVFVASGDSGAAGCDTHGSTPPVSQILSPSYICASSHATCVGGTEFADTGNPSQHWATTNLANFESAIGYIPEGGWNDPANSSNQPVVLASGGGVSGFIATPSWQTGTGVPGTQGRYTPDIAFSSSSHDGYFGCFAAAGGSCVLQSGSFPFIDFSGTSAAAPDMAGITALLNQKVGTPQGELNSNLYRLAATPSNNVFHDVTVASSGVSNCVVTTPSMCNNSTPSSTSQSGGLSGYLVGTGYDEVTGLGSIDVGNLLAAWSPTSGFAPVSTATVVAGQSVVIPLTLYAASGSGLTLALSCVGLPAKSSCMFSPNPVTPGPPPSGTTVQLTFVTASSQLPNRPSDRSPWPWQTLEISALLAGLLVTGVFHLRHSSGRRMAFGMCLAIVVLGSVLIGCGGTGGGSSSVPAYTGTPKGISTFTVTGTSGATTISTQVSVTVQ